MVQDAATGDTDNLSLFSLDPFPTLLLVKGLTVLAFVFLFGAQAAHYF